MFSDFEIGRTYSGWGIDFYKNKYGKDWDEYYLEDDTEWKKICKLKFINKIINK